MATVPPNADEGLERLGGSDAFADEVERLAELAPAARLQPRPGSLRWYAELDDDELMRLVRGVTSVDRAVKGYRRARDAA